MKVNVNVIVDLNERIEQNEIELLFLLFSSSFLYIYIIYMHVSHYGTQTHTHISHQSINQSQFI
jgi:hypothetical protein